MAWLFSGFVNPFIPIIAFTYGFVYFVPTIIWFGAGGYMWLHDRRVIKEDDAEDEALKGQPEEVFISIRRLPGTCCPEPTCDMERLEYIECEMCGHLCSECGRQVLNQ